MHYRYKYRSGMELDRIERRSGVGRFSPYLVQLSTGKKCPKQSVGRFEASFSGNLSAVLCN